MLEDDDMFDVCLIVGSVQEQVSWRLEPVLQLPYHASE